MNRIMIDKNLLDDFTTILTDVLFDVRLDLVYAKGVNAEKLYNLLDRLTDAWRCVYSPIDISIAQSMRRLYSQYIAAQKAGDLDGAEKYLQCYLVLKKG